MLSQNPGKLLAYVEKKLARSVKDNGLDEIYK